MKKINKLTIIGLAAGFLFSLLSAIRYFLIFPDLDRALVYILIGILIMLVSWLYSETKKNQKKNSEQEEDIFKIIEWIEHFEKRK